MNFCLSVKFRCDVPVLLHHTSEVAELVFQHHKKRAPEPASPQPSALHGTRFHLIFTHPLFFSIVDRVPLESKVLDVRNLRIDLHAFAKPATLPLHTTWCDSPYTSAYK